MPERPEKEITRPRFMTKFGQGLFVAHVAGTLLGATAAGGPRSAGQEIGLGRGWLGQSNLATHEILPAFAGCEKSKRGRAVPTRCILIDRVSTLPFDS
jgi:hypothetical protein